MEKVNIRTLAEHYETAEFINGDPSWFMHQVEGEANQETMAFIASALSYGSRAQFLPKIEYLLECSRGDVHQWVMSGDFTKDVPPSKECFYRLYTYKMMYDFLAALAQMLVEWGSMHNYVRQALATRVQENDSVSRSIPCRDALTAVKIITEWFATHGSSGVIPKNATSSCKRVCMFLRWMVRTDSPVDLGLWSDIIDKHTLIMPMDTHVVQEANRLGLISTHSTSMASAIRLTERLKDYFPDDPVKADFALFGMGVDSEL